MGSVVISLDAELGWGFHDMADPPRDRVEAGRRGWSVCLELFDEFDVPATWAVVGHLMLADCDGQHDGHPAPDGWFARERGAWADREDLRFGSDLVEDLLAADADHEFASHSFSHVLFGRPETDRALARAEIERALEIAEEWGLSIDSFVYPRNDVGHRDVLAEAGISAYRGRSPTRDGVGGIVDTRLRNRSLLVQPVVDEHGLVNVPASLFCYSFEGPRRTVAESIWTDPMVAQARRGIDEATRSDGLFHLWFHPNNLIQPRDDQRLRTILAHLERARERTDLTVETMGAVADRVARGDGVTGQRDPEWAEGRDLSGSDSVRASLE
ncbi:polysaccharide deacetylase [Natrarchaeobaculum aegyptiacum]|uniref:Polysaccharide deacetylase n=1 Tax=Natrarchaeobaculum aegyptiacum TaxID=745377 RepID=A0A2Z2HWS0_9EURY|nr:polysaccharide deacetylase [Natrarchaeobaculum aegyptiacum]